MARQRDYRAEYAARIAAGERRGVPRQVARGHRVAESLPRQVPLPRLPRGATPAQRAERAALVVRRRQQRHVAALRRQVETGEHGVYGYREDYPGSPGGWYWRQVRTPARVEREVARYPAETEVLCNAFGDLLEGYSSDWRGTRDRWQRIGTGLAQGPVAGVKGVLIVADWSADNVADLAFRAGTTGGVERLGPFEVVKVYELLFRAEL